MNSLLHRNKLKKSAIACLTAAAVFPAFAQSAPITASSSDALRGNSPANEAAPGATATTSQQQGGTAIQVPPIPSAETGSSAVATGAASAPVQGNSAAQNMDTQKNTINQTTPNNSVTGATGTDAGSSGTSQNAPATSAADTAQQTTNVTGGIEKVQNATPLQGTDNTLLIPNGAALQTQMLPLGGSESSPWTSYAAGAFLILGLAAVGVMVVRLRQGKAFGLNRSEKQMQLISTLALSPKRQILLIRIRDKEVAVAATEHGMTVLTEMPAQTKSLSQGMDDSGGEEPRRRKVQQRVVQDEPVKLVAAGADSLGEETAVARSEMLMGALKNLREKNLRGRPTNATQEVATSTRTVASESAAAEKRILDNLGESKGKGEPTLKQTRAAFPKYLANAFEQESKRNIPQSSTGANQSVGSDDASNVTNMIRERLKDLRPLA